MLEKGCPKCNAPTPGTANFCASCGHALVPAASPVPPANSSGRRQSEIITLGPDKGGPVIFKGALLATAASRGGQKVTLYRSDAGSYVLHQEQHDTTGVRSEVHVFKTAYALGEHCAGQPGEMKGLATEAIDEAARKDARISCLLFGR